MRNKYRFLSLSLTGILAILLLSAAINPASNSGVNESDLYLNDELSETNLSSPCISMLVEAANRAGLEGEIDTYDMEPAPGCHYDVSLSDDNGCPLVALNIYPIDLCGPWEVEGKTTFHGYNALATTYNPEGNETRTLDWKMYKGNTCYYLGVMTFRYSTQMHGSAPDPVPIAEAYLSVAEERLPLSEAFVEGNEEPLLPVDPEEGIPNGSDLGADADSIDDTDSSAEIPLPIILGSLGIPVVGAIAGAALSAILSYVSTASTSTTTVTTAVTNGLVTSTETPGIGSVNQEGQYWSERPYDEAGPGYVPKEEYERTKYFLDNGYKWDHGNWRTPDQIDQNQQWEQNDRDAVAREDAEWRAERENEQQALDKNKVELEEQEVELQESSNEISIDEMQEDMESIHQELDDEDIYVLNPYQGDPTLVFHGVNKAKNMVWDNTIGQWTGDQGLTCEGFVKKTRSKIIKSLAKRFPGATVQDVVFEEKSSINPEGMLDWFDSLNPDNHILTRIILPDGSEWAVDFHQYEAGNAPLLRPWEEARAQWKEYMGDEFMESVDRSEKVFPDSGK